MSTYIMPATYTDQGIRNVKESPKRAVARFALKLGSLGNVRTTTLKAFSEREYRTIVETLP
jgi:uncharacterized protein with GYD domain